MITAKEGTNFYKALTYLQPAVGHARYIWWTSGAVPEGPPAYAANKPAPDIETVEKGGIFCAGVPNLMLRRVGKRVATYGNHNFDGGTLAYQEYFRGFSEPFDLDRALHVAANERSGVLIGRPFRSSLDQGHVAVVLPSGYLLQSYDEANGNPGLNWNIPTAVSVRYWTPTYMVRPENWIDYKGDEF